MTSELVQHLNIGTSLLWVQTDEPLRTINTMVAELPSARKVYRMDAMDGLMRWEGKDGWKIVLLEQGDEGEEFPCRDLSLAMTYVFYEKGVFVLEYAHLVAEKIIPFLSTPSRHYSTAVFADDFDELPAQFVLLSHDNKFPPEIARELVRVNIGLPEAEKLAELLEHFVVNSGTTMTADEKINVVRAAQGLSESEFLHTSSTCLARHKKLDAEVVAKIKMESIKRDGILEIRRPTVSFEGVGGLDQAKEIMRRAAWINRHPEEAKKLQVEPLRRILLIGVQGCGKSLIAEAVAAELGLDLVKFGASQFMDKYVGQSEQNARKAFKQVAAMAPCVLWDDEFGRDMSGGQSSGEVDSGTTDRVHAEILQGMQELPDNVFLVAAANRIDSLPPEILRADRFDKILFVGLPTFEERLEILKIHLGDSAVNYDLDLLSDATNTFSGAEIKAYVRDVRFRVTGDHHRPPTTADFLKWAPKQKGRIWVNYNEVVKDMYKRAKREWDWASSAQEGQADETLKTPVSGKREDSRKIDIEAMFNDAIKK